MGHYKADLPLPQFLQKLWPLQCLPISSVLVMEPLPPPTPTHHLVLGKVSTKKALEREPWCIVFLEAIAAPVLDSDSGIGQ